MEIEYQPPDKRVRVYLLESDHPLPEMSPVLMERGLVKRVEHEDQSKIEKLTVVATKTAELSCIVLIMTPVPSWTAFLDARRIS